MKLSVLGCWAPFPAAGEACSGYLLESGGKRLLMDLGHGCFGKLQQVSDFRRLDAVFVSHLHPDHCADLSCLRHAVLSSLRQGETLSRLPVCMPAEPQDNYEVLAHFEDAFEIHVIKDDQTLDMAGINFRVFRTAHPIPTFGLVLEEGDKKFVYTSDTAWEDKLVDICLGANILLCEASLSQQEAHLSEKGHLTVPQAARLANEAGVKKLILTHLWPGYDLEKLAGEVTVLSKEGFCFARGLAEYCW